MFEGSSNERKQWFKAGFMYFPRQTAYISVAQMRVLGGSLFLAYISKEMLVYSNLRGVWFVYASCLVLIDSTYLTILNNFSSELEKRYPWLLTNKFSLNRNKNGMLSVCALFTKSGKEMFVSLYVRQVWHYWSTIIYKTWWFNGEEKVSWQLLK